MNYNEKHLRFAVIPSTVSTPTDSPDWLEPGLVFDLEKRLERWKSLKAADRFQLQKACKQAPNSSEAVLARSVMNRLGLDVVLTVSGEEQAGKLHLRTRLWTKGQKAAEEYTADGSTEELFSLQDSIVRNIVKSLFKAFPDLTHPDISARLYLHPSSSVKAYSLMIRGKEELQRSHIREARLYLTDALKSDPKSWWAYYFLAAVEFYDLDYEKAVEHCRSALTIDPDLYTPVYANLSYCYRGTGDYMKEDWAKKEFERRTGETLPDRPLPHNKK